MFELGCKLHCLAMQVRMPQDHTFSPCKGTKVCDTLRKPAPIS